MFTFWFFFIRLSAYKLRQGLSVGFDLLDEAQPFLAVFSVNTSLPPGFGLAFAFFPFAVSAG